MRRGSTARPVVVAVLLLVLGPAAALAESRDSKAQPRPASDDAGAASKEGAEAEKPRYDVKEDDVITNEDLERMMEGLSPSEARAGVYQAQAKPEPSGKPAVAAGGAATPAPGAAPPSTKPASKSQQVADAESKVAALQARVSELEKAVLAVKNPLLPRTWTTPDSTKDQDEQSGYADLDNQGRLAQRETELRGAREELSKARQELAVLRGRDDDEP